ncbi:glycoside hydrolase family protein [Nostoc sp. LEGE 12450]|uniref:glycoside hydrolase family protein n=1 Tax=Nostoc sp. LEGE 12450 TaxID=1828643 RepID=UPI001880A020|nr:glycoside hydrolase family protein [Nostoc sp. LEGE 12450]MBE8990385.1 glycoside hydrolase family protein [Nostoc sp. LEGE 12450]
MNISQNCLDLIKKWEGFSAKAYLDPVNIPTIGYGTIRYPNGQKVQMGDVVSEPEAEDLMKLECDEFAEIVNRNVKVTLNQNQFDSLVSFCYNVGGAGFQGSTLLKQLNVGNYSEAGEQFLVWNKGTIDGVKQVINGLTNRRKDEKALFEKTVGSGTPLEKAEPSPQNEVTWLQGYRESSNDATIIVARNKDNKIVEILTLESPKKEDLITVLCQYPNAQNFLLAPDSAVPAGERILIQKRQPDSITKVEIPPSLQNHLLIIGMGAEDPTPDSLKKDIENLQTRLRDLGYYQGEIDGNFGSNTDKAVKAFQAKVFGEDEADGKVGPITWAKLWGQDSPIIIRPVPSSPPTTSDKNYLKLTKTNRKDQYGCFILKMEYYKDSGLIDSLNVCSGAPGRQVFKTALKSVPKSSEPLPEGKWYIENIKWAGGKDHKDDYSGKYLFPDRGVGPVSTPLTYKEPNSTRRSAIEIHIDSNRRAGSPGTAGCVGLYTIADYQRFVSWLRETDPRDFYVDWGLGTSPKP